MIETENGAWPETNIHTHGASASHASIDNSVNKALPWSVMANAAAFLALGIVVSDHARIGDSIEHQNTMIRTNAENQATLIHNAENRAIDGQNMGLIAEQKCNSLEIEMARHNIVLQPTVKK